MSRSPAGLALAAALALLPVPARGQASGAGAQQAAVTVMEAAAAKFRATSSVCADFTQHLSVPLLGDERSGRGRLCQERPGRFAMRFTEPAGDAVVLDGTWVWIYYPSMDPKQVLRFPVAASPGGFDLFKEFLEDFASKYEVEAEGSEAVAGQSTVRVRLRPRRAASYRAAVVWIQPDGVLRQVRVEEENGSVRTVTLTRVQMGAAPPAGWFVFTPPPGAQVVG